MALHSLDPAARAAVDAYMSDVSRLPNESTKTHRFVSLLTSLFGQAKPVTRLIGGIEKAVYIDVQGAKARRVIDAYHGHAIIEFEHSLKKSLKTAELQLREQCAGVWNGEPGARRPLLAIASDGLEWRTYRPRPDQSKTPLGPSDVTLEHLGTIELRPATARKFYLWLTSWLFRPASVIPSTDQFQTDFGAASPLYADAMLALHDAWTVAGSAPHPHLCIDTWIRYLTVTYGSLGGTKQKRGGLTPEIVELFLKHTYLASVARLLSWATLADQGARARLKGPADILSGAAFEALNLRNLVEDDFFQWVKDPAAAKVLDPLWEGLLSQLDAYDLARIDQDVLKGVYQEPSIRRIGTTSASTTRPSGCANGWSRKRCPRLDSRASSTLLVALDHFFVPPSLTSWRIIRVPAVPNHLRAF